ncbi:MAG: ribonuclease P protein component [Acidimicrobiia bacterium]|nr:ribonuclease P protein component [Acidimicrobiia bacterium]
MSAGRPVTPRRTGRLTPAERLRQRPEFERVYEDGSRLSGRFMVLFRRTSGHARARLGVAASRKLGTAVERNRLKRLARELFRHHRPSAGLDLVIVPRREMLHAPYPRLEADFQELLTRAPRPGDRPRHRSSARRAGRTAGV